MLVVCEGEDAGIGLLIGLAQCLQEGLQRRGDAYRYSGQGGALWDSVRLAVQPVANSDGLRWQLAAAIGNGVLEDGWLQATASPNSLAGLLPW